MGTGTADPSLPGLNIPELQAHPAGFRQVPQVRGRQCGHDVDVGKANTCRVKVPPFSESGLWSQTDPVSSPSPATSSLCDFSQVDPPP